MIVYFLPLLTQRRYNVPTRNEAHNTQKRREFIFPKYPRKAEKNKLFYVVEVESPLLVPRLSVADPFFCFGARSHYTARRFSCRSELLSHADSRHIIKES